MREAENNWKSLYKIGGAATLILLAYSLITILVMGILGMPPGTADGVFAMLQADKFTGLLRLDVLTLFVMPLYYLLFLGFYTALKKTHAVYAAIAGLLGCAGLTLFLATPSVFSWLALADKFAATTSEAQKTLLLAAGEAILASDMWHGSGALVGGLLMQTGILMFSVVMLRSPAFGKVTAWLGVVMHSLDLLHILVGFFLPAGGVALMMVAGPLYLVWFPLLARDFFRLGKE
jgi:hypothetical protein